MPRYRCAAIILPSLSFLIGGASAGPAVAADPVRLTLQDHRFTPSEITVPAGEKFVIEIENQDDTPEEFDSADLHVEKIIAPKSRIVIPMRPLKPGRYGFTGEYHPDTAGGTIIVTEQGSK